MSRSRPAITPTDKGMPPPNPAWKRSPPREVVIDGRRCVEVDAMTLADAAEWYRVARVEPAR